MVEFQGMKRAYYLEAIERHFKTHSVVALLGPRQVGKSTLAREFLKNAKKNIHFFDLEDPTDLARLSSPKLALQDLNGYVVIDEIQRRPDLFPVIRVVADQKKIKFLILGSASRDLINQGSETLAGRIAYIEVRPFTVLEQIKTKPLWLKGGFPVAYLAKSEQASRDWLKNYTSTFLERDIPALGINIPAQTLRKFWMMLAHYHGNVFNASEIGKSLGFSGQTARRYLDVLVSTFLMRELQPWSENIAKRQIKSPKIYFRDSGLFHYLLNLRNLNEISNHPKLGASWEGFALEQISAHLGLESDEMYFWGTHAEAELDLLIFKNNEKIGIEIKYTDSPVITKSMNIAMNDLNLKKLYIIYPGKTEFRLSSKITAFGFENIKYFDPF